MAKILLIEDDPETADSIIDSLELANYIVEWVSTKKEGLERLQIYSYDIAILDWMLAGESGLELCREYRNKGYTTPILMLTSRDEVSDRVAGLEVGADDYLTKPFAMSELQARVRSVLRRSSEKKLVTLSVGALTLDPLRGVAIIGNEEVALRRLEISVLEFLMRHPGTYFTAIELLNQVWSSESESTEDAVRKTITRLREKIDVDGNNYIVSAKNLGYRIADPKNDFVKTKSKESDGE